MTSDLPKDARAVAFQDGKLQVPDHPILPFIRGDGTGPDLWAASVRVFDAAVAKAYGGKRKIAWLELMAGEASFQASGEWLPQATLESLRKYRVAIKGPLTTPVGGGIRSLNVALRQILDLYACVRPVSWVEGVPAPVKQPDQLDVVIFRENTEDVYAGIEWQAHSKEADRLIEFVNNELKPKNKIRAGSGVGIKPISAFGTERLVRMALQYALDHGRRSVTLVHKGNIMKYTEGSFRDWGYALAQKEFSAQIVREEELWSSMDGKLPAGKLLVNDRIADAMFQQVLLRPAEYSVLATPNLNGDYLSDACAAQVGGLGMAPGANIGDGFAVFEATHGTAPKYAGQDKVNPGSLILSGAMMFDYLGWGEAAALIRSGVAAAVSTKKVTYDLARQLAGATTVRCSEFADGIIAAIG
ncbi:MAG TPA: isocitrate dehydrogenase (NADP(+)) [Acidobacteriota bacterium]